MLRKYLLAVCVVVPFALLYGFISTFQLLGAFSESVVLWAFLLATAAMSSRLVLKRRARRAGAESKQRAAALHWALCHDLLPAVTSVGRVRAHLHRLNNVAWKGDVVVLLIPFGLAAVLWWLGVPPSPLPGASPAPLR